MVGGEGSKFPHAGSADTLVVSQSASSRQGPVISMRSTDE
jgi:hypothetical protein